MKKKEKRRKKKLGMSDFPTQNLQEKYAEILHEKLAKILLSKFIYELVKKDIQKVFCIILRDQIRTTFTEFKSKADPTGKIQLSKFQGVFGHGAATADNMSHSFIEKTFHSMKITHLFADVLIGDCFSDQYQDHDDEGLYTIISEYLWELPLT